VTRQTTQGTHGSAAAPVELLVILGPDGGVPVAAAPGAPRPLTALAVLASLVPVSQAYPPRLALVSLPLAAAGPLLAGQPYIVGVYQDAPPAAVLATLDVGERIFVDAWLERVEAARCGGRPRPGDGLSWDAPGYEPPDPPGPAIAG
jgi:hypothetical protein